MQKKRICGATVHERQDRYDDRWRLDYRRPASAEQNPLGHHDAAHGYGWAEGYQLAEPVRDRQHEQLPLVSPTTFFVVVLSTIAAFQVFDQTFVMTAGGPAYSTTTLALFIYQNAFQWFHMGYAAALSYVLFAAVAMVTLGQFRVQGRFVFYR